MHDLISGFCVHQCLFGEFIFWIFFEFLMTYLCLKPSVSGMSLLKYIFVALVEWRSYLPVRHVCRVITA